MVKCVHYEVCYRAENGEPPCRTCKNYSDGIHGPDNTLLANLTAIREDLLAERYIDSNSLLYTVSQAIMVIEAFREYATVTSIADKVLDEKREIWQKALRGMSEGAF